MLGCLLFHHWGWHQTQEHYGFQTHEVVPHPIDNLPTKNKEVFPADSIFPQMYPIVETNHYANLDFLNTDLLGNKRSEHNYFLFHQDPHRMDIGKVYDPLIRLFYQKTFGDSSTNNIACLPK